LAESGLQGTLTFFGYIIGAVWIHAVSVGETRAAQPLIEAYLARGESILLTHMTLNGRRTGAQLFAKAIASGKICQVYLPYDLCWSVDRFLKVFKPKLGVKREDLVKGDKKPEDNTRNDDPNFGAQV
jgi:hypothetical protein